MMEILFQILFVALCLGAIFAAFELGGPTIGYIVLGIIVILVFLIALKGYQFSQWGSVPSVGPIIATEQGRELTN